MNEFLNESFYYFLGDILSFPVTVVRNSKPWGRVGVNYMLKFPTPTEAAVVGIDSFKNRY